MNARGDGDDSRRLNETGTLVEDRRRAAGLTQQQLAERSGISIGAIRDLEQGRTTRPRPGSLESLAQVLGLRLDHLAVPGGRPHFGRGRIRLSVLGPLSVWRDGVPVVLAGGRLRAVLALLAVKPGSAVHRASIIDAIWGESPPPTALGVVQSCVSQLRHVLGARADDPQRPGQRERARPDGLVVTAGETYSLRASADQLDLLKFTNLAARARRAAKAGNLAGACEMYERSLRLWRGDPLADVAALRTHPAVADLARQRAAVVLEYAEAAGSAGWHGRVLEHLQALAGREPLDERAHAWLMITLAATGQQAAALMVFEGARRRLDHELGIDPGPELADAHLRVLRGQVGRSVPVAAADTEGTASVDGEPPGSERAGGEGQVSTTSVAQPDLALPRQLPSATRHFTGRTAELKAMWQVLDQVGEQPGTVVISAISGMAGIGKTALAVHWAHGAAGRFPDGQLFVDLCGTGPSGVPAGPAQVIRWFLGSLGVPVQRVPSDQEAQAALYRSVLAGKRVLLVLDNARDVGQVRPLLPGSPGCMVVVTSRNQLTGLAAAEGAHLLALDVLADAEAGDLLARRLGTARLADEPTAAAELTELCGRLPLALAITAARAAARPGFALSALAGELREESSRLDALDTRESGSSLRAAFSWSYRQLSEPAARMFRLLGIRPGPDITTPASASLAGIPSGRARQALAELADVHLLTELAPDRYAQHDLLRVYAAEQAAADTDDDSQAALARVLDHYLHTAHTAALLFAPQREPITLAPLLPGVTPEQLADGQQAITWFEAECRVLLAAVSLAAASGFDACAWQLPWAVMNFLDARGQWHECAASQRIALEAARRLGEMAGQAMAHRYLATAYARFGDYGQASVHLADCLGLYQQLGDHAGEARAHQALSWVAERKERPGDALGHAEQAVRLFRVTGDRAGLAGALNAVGWCHARLDDPQQARAFCRRALALYRELGVRRDTAWTWDSLGYAEHRVGRLGEAATCYQNALSLFRELGDRFYQADALTHLGDVRQDAGDPQAARKTWREALDILDDLNHPDAAGVRERLAER